MPRLLPGVACLAALVALAYLDTLFSDVHLAVVAGIVLIAIAGIFRQLWFAIALAAVTAIAFGYIDFSPHFGSRISVASFPIDSALLAAQFVSLILLVHYGQRRVRENARLEAALSRSHHIAEEHRRMAANDPVTSLPNRAFLDEALRISLEKAAGDGTKVGLVFIDLEGLTHINDEYGHEVGDEALRIAAEGIRRATRAVDLAAHWQRDAFLVLMDRVRVGEADLVAQKIREAFSLPVGLRQGPIVLAASVGVAYFPINATTAHGLVLAAERAMIGDKSARRAAAPSSQP